MVKPQLETEAKVVSRERILSTHFLSRKDAFAQWNRDKFEWQCIHKDIPDYLVKGHLEGKITVATYPVNELGNTPFVCFDIDTKGQEAHEILSHLQQWFRQLGILFLLEDTGGRGLHGWSLFLCYAPAAKAIALANWALNEVQKNQGTLPSTVEIFPKQAKPKDVGNPIRLPWGKHQSGQWSHFLDNNFEPDDDTAIHAIQVSNRTTEFDLDKLLPKEVVKKVTAKMAVLASVDERWGEVIPEGKRHNILLSLAGELRNRRFGPDKLLTELRMHNQQRCQPPLQDKEVEEIAKGISQKTTNEKGGNGEDSYATTIVNLLDDSYLFHDTVGDPFIRFSHNNHQEIWPLDSQAFEHYAKYLFYCEKKKVPSSSAMSDAIATLSGKAKFDAPRHELGLRVAWHDNALWYDLSNDNWQAIRVDKEGWQIVDGSPVIFERYPHMAPQATPVSGGDVHDFLGFVNLSDENDKLLLLVWLILSFVSGFAHPGLMPFGSWGSAKTFLFRLLKNIIDPSAIETLSFAVDRSEFVQQLSHHWACLYDNVHNISQWVSDLLCRAITGEGFSKRRLYTDREDIVFKFRRIVGVDGLELAAESPDLLDRSIILELQPIPDDKRKRELTLWQEFLEAKPGILGGIFETLTKMLQLLPTIEVAQLPRMADWTVYGCAVAEALGYEQANFLQAYGQAVIHQSLEALKASLTGETLLAFMEARDEYEDTMAMLLKDLSTKAEQLHIDVKGKGWPKQPNQLSKTLKAMAPNLGKEKIYLTFLGHTKGGSKIRITKTPSPLSPRVQTEGDDTSDGGAPLENVPSLTTVTSELASGDDGDDENDLKKLAATEQKPGEIDDYPIHPCLQCGKDAWGLSPAMKYYCVECVGDE